MEKTIWEQFLDHVEPHLPEYLHWNEICWTFVYYLAEARRHIHRWCRGMEAWEIVVNTVTYCFFVWLAIEVFRWVLYWIFFQDESFPDRVKRSFFRIVRQVPIVKDKIAAEMQKSKDTMQEVAFPERKGEKYYTMLPPKGLKEVALMDEIEDYLKIGDVDWNDGKVSGTVYNGSKDLTRILTTVYSKFAWSNPLHPDIFPGVRKMEAEVVQMCLDLFNGGKDSCGTMTIGGTESILMACKAYRGLAYERGIKKPEIVAPLSIHAAFDKAAHYFGIKLVHVPLEENTMKCNLRALRRAITRSTIAIAGSAPQYPHGVIDPIEEMAALAKKYNLGLHVDCCLGGFVVPFMKKAGYQVAPFDFSVEGVTSISVDTHKYGNCPKGSSVIMYSNKPLRRHQYFVAPNWQGGIYACPTVPGSRAGGIIAATWASLIFHGMSGYVECTRNIIQARLRIEEGLKKIKDIFVFGKPDVSVVAFGSKKFDIFSLSNEMGRRGWHLNPLQFPPGVHICITNLHTKPGVVDRFIKDVKESAAIVMKDPNATTTGVGAIYGMAQSIPDRSMVSELACEFLDSIYTIPLDRPKHKAKEK